MNQTFSASKAYVLSLWHGLFLQQIRTIWMGLSCISCQIVSHFLCVLFDFISGSGFLVSFLLLSLPCSLMSYPAHNKGPIANLTDCLHFSEQLMKEANLSLLSFKVWHFSKTMYKIIIYTASLVDVGLCSSNFF